MNKAEAAYWVSKTPEALPDFIIGGAMKSGTTTLHAILNKHPDIGIAHDELGFFDMDSLLQHPDYNFFNSKDKSWTTQSMTSDNKLLWHWYHSQFENLHKDHNLVGEDSTTYLASGIAAKRIAEQNKSIKMIFVLRHPTKRTISNYLHLLKSGRAIYTLEDTLKYTPHSIINRSSYLEQLRAYYHYLPHTMIKVILFEDLIHEREDCIKEVCEFLNIDFNKYQPEDLNVHSNRTVVPKFIALQLIRNKWMQRSRDYRYAHFLPNQPDFQDKLPLKFRVIEALHKRINPKMGANQFTPEASTVTLLDTFFKTEMEGIDELTQKTIYSKWFNN